MKLITTLFHDSDNEYTLFAISIPIPPKPKTKRQLQADRLYRIAEQTCRPRTRA
jgi:hypothetical protein